MRVRVTEKLRGELVLPTISTMAAIKSRQFFDITDEQYCAADIQQAIKFGILIVEKTEEDIENKTYNILGIKNLSQKPITLSVDGMDLMLLPLQTQSITSQQLQNVYIQQLIDANIFEVIQTANPLNYTAVQSKQVEEKTEPAVTPEIVEEKVEKAVQNIMEVDIDAIKDKEVAQKHDTTMGAWDPEKQEMLNKGNAGKKLASQLGSQDMKKVDDNDEGGAFILESNEKDVVWVDLGEEDAIAESEVEVAEPKEEEATPKKKRGRPKGSKNKNKKSTSKKATIKNALSENLKVSEKIVDLKPGPIDPLIHEPQHEGPDFVYGSQGKELEFVDQEQKEIAKNNSEIN